MADALATEPGSLTEALSFPVYARRAYLGSAERNRLPASFGALTAERLTSVLQQLQRGEVEQWADLVQFALKDDLFVHLNTTRVTRVAQADYQVVPNQFGNPQQAKLAAEFVNEMLGLIENWDLFVRNALHAIALGYSANEIEWERDSLRALTYVRNLHYINPNRFRYDDQWKLRLYDHGMRCQRSQSLAGEPLWPTGWVVHTHSEMAGDPCDYGLMRSCIWRWLFRRWADTFWIQNLEKYGAPFIYAEVTANTPLATRDRIKENLIDLGIDRAAVIEAGGKIVLEPPAMGTGSASQHELYMDFAQKSLTATWLGASDVTSPGENGSQAAVGGRISATTDPRMVTDGVNLCGTLHRQLFKWLIHHNLHKFDGVPPIPMMQMKTASDEAKTDEQDLATQNQADRDSGQAPTQQLPSGEQPAPYEVRGDPDSPSLDGTLAEPTAPDPTSTPALADTTTVKKQETALNGAQVSSMLEVIQQVVTGLLPRDSAQVIIQIAYNLDATTADQLLGSVGRGFEPTPEPVAAPPPLQASNPKASSRSNQGRPMAQPNPMTIQRSQPKTSQTSSASIGPLESVLRGQSVDPQR